MPPPKNTPAAAAKTNAKTLAAAAETAGANECKTHGGCHVPLMESAWETLRKRKRSRVDRQETRSRQGSTGQKSRIAST